MLVLEADTESKRRLVIKNLKRGHDGLFDSSSLQQKAESLGEKGKRTIASAETCE